MNTLINRDNIHLPTYQNREFCVLIIANIFINIMRAKESK